MLLDWLRAFVLTQIVEVPIYRRALRSGFWESFGASALTHPLVFWFNASHVWQVSWGWRAAACELFAWWAEALYFAALGRDRVVRWTLVANAASFFIGLVGWWLAH